MKNKTRNILCIVQLAVYLLLVTYFEWHFDFFGSDSGSILMSAILYVGAIGLSILSTPPTFKSEKSGKAKSKDVEKPVGIEDCDCLLVEDTFSQMYQLFICNSTYVFKKIKKDSDVVEDVDGFRLNDLKKGDLSIPFSSIKSVVYNDYVTESVSGELRFKYEKQKSFYVIDIYEQEEIDSFFKNVKYSKKAYRAKLDNAQKTYKNTKRLPLAIVSYISKLLMPFILPIGVMIELPKKPIEYYVFLIIGLIGFFMCSYMCIFHLLIAKPNEKYNLDNIDIVSDSSLTGIVTSGLVIFSLLSINYVNDVYVFLLFLIPSAVVAAVCFFKNRPKTDMEILTRVVVTFTTALIIVSSICFIGPTQYDRISGTVKDVFHSKNSDTATVEQANSNVIEINGDYEIGDKLDMVYYKTKTGIKYIIALGE